MAESKNTSNIDVKIASDEIVDQWFIENFHGVIGLTTEMYNRFYEAKESLKQKLKETK